MEVQNRGLIGSITHSIHKKSELFEHSPVRYMARSFFASFYLAIGVATSTYMAAKGDHLAEGLGKFLYAAMFSWALIMIIYMNAELGTSNMMYMTWAMHRKVLTKKRALTILFTCILFNALGGYVVSFLLAQTSTFSHLEPDHYIITATTAKLLKTPFEQFLEGVFANIIVNTAVFCSIRMKDDAGKIIAMWMVVFIFSFLGFEHVIANFSLFTLAHYVSHGVVEGMSAASVLSSFLWSGLGNYVGGGICIGLLYSWLNTKTELYFD